ncbi:MAG TPA: hypothetical protein VEI48_04550, partial [Candidatus Sulfotelmatobacter sp.]|nr:hypothetical protein [Candidatus Sulfotelmatobacter sp.]
MAEASPRVMARLAGLVTGLGPDASVPNEAPALAAPIPVVPPTPAPRPRSISSVLVPWAGNSLAASRAATAAVS